LVYRLGFALLGCTVSLSAVALFLILVSKRSKNSSDNVAIVFMAAIISGVLVWFAAKLFEETSKRRQ
jgi:Kef-type K+ transport system membrane component KefB